MRKLCVKMCANENVHYTSQPDDGKEVRETWTKIRALSDESRKESWSIPRTSVQIQACQQKINATSECLRCLNIQRAQGWGSAECCAVRSTQPKRAGTKICSWLKLPALPKRIEMNSSSLRKRETEWGCLHSQRESRRVPEELSIVTNWLEERSDRSFQVPTFRLTSLCYFWENDQGIRWQRVLVVVGLLLDEVINFACEKPIYCPSTVLKEKQCTEVVPMYYGESSRRAESDVTELWLADDLGPLVCKTLIGWRKKKHVEDWKGVDNVFHGHRKSCSKEKSEQLSEEVIVKWKGTLRWSWWWSSGWHVGPRNRKRGFDSQWGKALCRRLRWSA